MPRYIIALEDTLANEITGVIQIFPHPAPAIRFFGDIASHPESNVGRHIDDYRLVSLGTLNDDNTIAPDKQVIITGSQWKASQQLTTNQETA